MHINTTKEPFVKDVDQNKLRIGLVAVDVSSIGCTQVCITRKYEPLKILDVVACKRRRASSSGQSDSTAYNGDPPAAVTYSPLHRLAQVNRRKIIRPKSTSLSSQTVNFSTRPL